MIMIGHLSVPMKSGCDIVFNNFNRLYLSLFNSDGLDLSSHSKAHQLAVALLQHIF